MNSNVTITRQPPNIKKVVHNQQFNPPPDDTNDIIKSLKKRYGISETEDFTPTITTNKYTPIPFKHDIAQIIRSHIGEISDLARPAPIDLSFSPSFKSRISRPLDSFESKKPTFNDYNLFSRTNHMHLESVDSDLGFQKEFDSRMSRIKKDLDSIPCTFEVRSFEKVKLEESQYIDFEEYIANANFDNQEKIRKPFSAISTVISTSIPLKNVANTLEISQSKIAPINSTINNIETTLDVYQSEIDECNSPVKITGLETNDESSSILFESRLNDVIDLVRNEKPIDSQDESFVVDSILQEYQSLDIRQSLSRIEMEVTRPIDISIHKTDLSYEKAALGLEDDKIKVNSPDDFKPIDLNISPIESETNDEEFKTPENFRIISGYQDLSPLASHEKHVPIYMLDRQEEPGIFDKSEFLYKVLHREEYVEEDLIFKVDDIEIHHSGQTDVIENHSPSEKHGNIENIKSDTFSHSCDAIIATWTFEEHSKIIQEESPEIVDIYDFDDSKSIDADLNSVESSPKRSISPTWQNKGTRIIQPKSNPTKDQKTTPQSHQSKTNAKPKVTLKVKKHSSNKPNSSFVKLKSPDDSDFPVISSTANSPQRNERGYESASSLDSKSSAFIIHTKDIAFTNFNPIYNVETEFRVHLSPNKRIDISNGVEFKNDDPVTLGDMFKVHSNVSIESSGNDADEEDFEDEFVLYEPYTAGIYSVEEREFNLPKETDFSKAAVLKKKHRDLEIELKVVNEMIKAKQTESIY